MKSKNVIITGTSRGIGHELVKLFANAGHRVLSLTRHTQTVDELQLDNVTSFAFDLTKAEDFIWVDDFINTNWDQVDILINNAGKLINKPFAETRSSDFESVYKTNVFGAAELIRVAVPFMKKDGHVINISSMGGVQGSVKFPGLSAYSSSKGALITLTELLAEEYKDTGPSFNVLALGSVQTEMLDEAFPGYQAPVSAKEMANYIYDFALKGNKFYNGKILQVSSSTP